MANLKNFHDYKEYVKMTFCKLCIIQFSKDAVSWFGDLYNAISSYNKNSTKISVISRYDTEYNCNLQITCVFLESVKLLSKKRKTLRE